MDPAFDKGQAEKHGYQVGTYYRYHEALSLVVLL